MIYSYVEVLYNFLQEYSTHLGISLSIYFKIIIN